MNIEIGLGFGYFTPYPLLKCSTLSGQCINVDYQGCLTFCCQLSNYGDIDVVKNRTEIVCDLHDHSLLHGYQMMQDLIAAYNKEKAVEASRGDIKGMDLFPCFYCTKKFGKLDWLKDNPHQEALKDWTDQSRVLNQPLWESEAEWNPKKSSFVPNF